MLLKSLVLENSRIADAYAFARRAHRGHMRKNGEPYFNHAVDVASMIAELNLDEDTIIAALLHDVHDQIPHTVKEISSQFGQEIAHLVEGVELLGTIKYHGNAAQRQTVRNSILGGIDDARILMIKLADRLDEMKSIAALPAEKQKRVALETMEIYSPLAAQLGMHRISGELAETAFSITHPKEYQHIVALVKDRYRERTAYLKQITPILKVQLGKHLIKPMIIDHRAKHYYSLYEKLKKSGDDIGRIYDLIAIRIIVSSIEECYSALGAIHSLWPPVPGKIKDYIALPKENGYQSLHTTVFSPREKITEIQIRTSDMHMEAEHGIAAHAIYKQSNNKASSRRINHEIIRGLRQWKENPLNITSFKIDFFKDRIFVNTPKGEVIDLPAGATPVDFAYQIHTEVGNTCRGAMVNNKNVPLNFQLRSGDTIEILTQKNKRPSESWLGFIKTNAAKYHIRTHIKRKRQRTP